MKKVLSMILVLAMVVSLLSACGGNGNGGTETTQPAASVEGSMEELVNKVIEEQPVEFAGGVSVLDLSDTSEEGLWVLKSCTGLDSADDITDAAAFEPMINAIAFSLVMVRVAPGVESKTVAEAMKEGVDPRKWICVEADDLLVAGFGDVVMLIMVDSSSGMTAQSFVDACQEVTGMEPAFVI